MTGRVGETELHSECGTVGAAQCKFRTKITPEGGADMYALTSSLR